MLATWEGMRTITTIALLAFAFAVMAQEGQPPVLPSPDPGCILQTPEEVWTSLGLSSAEKHQVQGIQTRCETECTSLEETGRYDLDENAAVLRRYHDEVRALLGDERYHAWQKWCATRTGRTQR